MLSVAFDLPATFDCIGRGSQNRVRQGAGEVGPVDVDVACAPAILRVAFQRQTQQSSAGAALPYLDRVRLEQVVFDGGHDAETVQTPSYRSG